MAGWMHAVCPAAMPPVSKLALAKDLSPSPSYRETKRVGRSWMSPGSEAAEGQGENREKKTNETVKPQHPEFISCSRHASGQGSREKLESHVLNKDRCKFPASLF